MHVNEITRRNLNTSRRQDSSEKTAPILTDYMVMMKEAGYDENCRKLVLERAFKSHDRIMK